MTIVNEYLARWVSGTRVIHLDFHSGLGNYAKYKLLCPLLFDWQYFHRYETLFGTQVESLVGHGGVGYTTRRGLGRYLKTMFRDRHYHFLYVEFETYSPIWV